MPEPVPTLRAVFDWYLDNMPRQPRPVVLVERKRIWEIFCAYRGEDNGPPWGERPYTFFRPFHLLQFIKAQPGLKAAATRKRNASRSKSLTALAASVDCPSRRECGRAWQSDGQPPSSNHR